MSAPLKPLLLIVAALSTSVFAAARTHQFIGIERRIRMTDRDIAALRTRPAARETGSDGIEAELHRLAGETKIRRLLSVATTIDDGGLETAIEWESDARTSLAFLGLLRERGVGAALPRLTLTTLESEPGTIRGRAALRPGPTGERLVMAASGRDPFRPLWKNDVQFARLASENIRRQEEERRRDQEKQAKEQRERDAQNQKESRRRAFETRYTLSGIVSDGKGPIAFLTGDNQRSYMVRAGERIGDASVSAINAAAGEVRLSGEEDMSVVLKIGVPGARP